MEVTCPLCGEFDGSVASVQGHISSKKDEKHAGTVGDDVLKDPGDVQEIQGKDVERPGEETQGTVLDMPEIKCKGCGRRVKYPELMPYKMTCPKCSRTMQKRDAAEQKEKEADEIGKDELAEPADV